MNEKNYKEPAGRVFPSITDGINSPPPPHFNERVSPPLPTATFSDNINCQVIVWKPHGAGKKGTAELEVVLGRGVGEASEFAAGVNAYCSQTAPRATKGKRNVKMGLAGGSFPRGLMFVIPGDLAGQMGARWVISVL